MVSFLFLCKEEHICKLDVQSLQQLQGDLTETSAGGLYRLNSAE